MSVLPRRLSVVAVLALVVVFAGAAIRSAHDDSQRHYLDTAGWPDQGQAAYVLGTDAMRSTPHQSPVPIASLAKVMTAFLVLQAAPIDPVDDDGFQLTVTDRDVAETAFRTARDESLVRVEQGEVLTERQALAALLLPSANNVAIMLARHIAGTVHSFVRKMNRAARAFGMWHTRYSDPSGFEDTTRSTAADQVVLAQIAMRNRTFASIVALKSYPLPVVGTVQNTDRLLGTHGFVGIKTGSDDAAGGCFMFRAHRTIDGEPVDLTGVVLGQPGHNLVMTGQYAARQLADRVTRTR
jgi:D-alanyl-D-alanine carboxypeptidase (penicillin-binding protein 5/6)